MWPAWTRQARWQLISSWCRAAATKAGCPRPPFRPRHILATPRPHPLTGDLQQLAVCTTQSNSEAHVRPARAVMAAAPEVAPAAPAPSTGWAKMRKRSLLAASEALSTHTDGRSASGMVLYSDGVSYIHAPADGPPSLGVPGRPDLDVARDHRRHVRCCLVSASVLLGCCAEKRALSMSCRQWHPKILLPASECKVRLWRL